MPSCFKGTANSGPAKMRMHALHSSVSFRKLRQAAFSPARRFSDARLYLAVAYAGLGDKSNAHEQARQGVAEYENDALFKPIAEAFRAKALAQLGEVDAAIDALPHLLEVPGGIHPGELRFSPLWDPLRKDPRFEALLKNPPPVRY